MKNIVRKSASALALTSAVFLGGCFEEKAPSIVDYAPESIAPVSEDVPSISVSEDGCDGKLSVYTVKDKEAGREYLAFVAMSGSTDGGIHVVVLDRYQQNLAAQAVDAKVSQPSVSGSMGDM